MRRPFAGRAWPLVAGAVVLSAGATAFGAVARPAQSAPVLEKTVPVAASVRVCAATGDGQPLAKGTTTWISTASLPSEVAPTADAASATASWLRVTHLSGSSTPLAAVTSPGAQAIYRTSATNGLTKPTVLRAQGSLAPGAAVTQVTYDPSGVHRALIGSSCPTPTANAWFVGGSGTTGRLTTVELDNPDSTPAVADVLVFGEHGPVAAPAGRGVAIAPHGSTIVRVDVLAPGTVTAALHVILREGRAAVTVTDLATSGLIPKGADVIPETAAPAKSVVIAGVPGGVSGSRTLEILTPGDQDALVHVQVLGRDGRFTPDNLAALDVPAGTVGVAQLLSQVGDGSVGLQITSDMPIVAAVRNVLPSAKSTPDVTYSVATHSLRVPVLAPGLHTNPHWVTRLFLAAPSTGGQVTVTLLEPDGTSSSAQEKLVGGTSGEYVFSQGQANFTVLVTPAPDSGPVFAAVGLDYTDSVGQLATQWPLVGESLMATLPVVTSNPALGVPGS